MPLAALIHAGFSMTKAARTDHAQWRTNNRDRFRLAQR